MTFFNSFYYFFNHIIYFISIRDLIEIFFLSICIYGITRLFTADSSTKLLVYFYYYCGFLFVAYTFNLETILWALTAATPSCAVLFFLFHQKQLQKNFITLQSIYDVKITESINTPELIIRYSLTAFSHNKKINWIIQNNNLLTSYLTTQYLLQAPLTQEFFAFTITNPLYDSNFALWIDAAGKLQGINVSWAFKNDNSWYNPSVNTLNEWQQQALELSLKTDVHIVQTNPLDHTFSVMINGHLYQNLSAQHTLQLLKKNNPFKKYHSGALVHEKTSSKITDQPH